MRRLVGLLVLLLALTACGREADVAFRESGVQGEQGEPGELGQHIEGGQGGFGEEPAPEQPVDDGAVDPDTPVSSDGEVSTSPGSTGSAGGGTSGSTGTGERTPGNTGSAPQPEPTPEPGEGDGYTEPRPGQADVRAREWESAEVQSDDRTIVVTWWSGVEPCAVLDRVEVREEAERVVITLYEGRDPNHDGACIAMAVERKTKVTVSQPVAGREIVDGAKQKGG